MKQHLKNGIILGMGFFLLSGCSGYDRILFITKTNVGLDIDDTPPTAEITIARRELAITPTYQHTTGDLKTLPLLGSFGLTGGAFNPEISSVFSGGDAAVILVTKKEEVPKKINSAVCLSQDPDARSPIKRLWHLITGTKKEEVTNRTRAFYFATDTAFGVKVGWNGTGGPYPTSLKLGYNRLELASPPILITKGCGAFEAKVPSFFASLDNKSNFLTGPGDSGVTHVQFFATGAVANAWVKRPKVKAETILRMRGKETKETKETE